jgi:hypothetical protein
MNKLSRILSFLIFFNVTVPSIAQLSIKGIVIEKETKRPIAFATILFEKQMHQDGVISDIHGRFVINESDIKTITATCIGYKPNKVSISSNSKENVIELETNVLEVNEIVVTPENNPAIRVIKKVLENKKRNNFENYNNYSFRCYTKTIIDVKISNNATSKYSANISRNIEIDKRAALLSETVIYSSKNAKATENKIIATKTSGFKDPMFGQLSTSTFHNAISFYNNSISLFEMPLSDDKSISEYVSPLSDGCIGSYTYELNDTYQSSNDSIFVISFYPKKGRNFNSLKGKLFISSNNYAIKNIIVEPFEKGLIDFKFRQDYKFVNSNWFPVLLNQEIGFIAHRISKNINVYPVYLITSKIDSIGFNPSINKRNINLEKVFFDDKSICKSDSILQLVRSDSLTVREKNTYHTMDSIGQKHHFDFMMNSFINLSLGKIPVGYFDFNLYDLYNYNEYEGTRLGLGFYSNQKFLKNASFGGFIGYGLKDEKLKYDGQVVFNINKYHEIQLKVSYKNTLKEVGMDVIDDYSNLSTSEYLRTYIGARFDNCIEDKIEFNFRAFRYLKISSAVSLKALKPTYAYSFKGSTVTNFRADEFELSAQYSYKEQLATIANQRIKNGDGNPIISVEYKQGTNLFSPQSYKYNRIEATIDIVAFNGKFGQSKLRFATGFIDKSIPYGLLFTGEGSKSTNLPLLINNSFQTMMPNEFLSDKYANLFYSHNFGSLLFKTSKFKPQFVVIQNSGWGNLNNQLNHGIDFKVKKKVYLESGVIINNMVRLKYANMVYVGFGVGVFYRYGHYSFENVNDNLALKATASISLK